MHPQYKDWWLISSPRGRIAPQLPEALNQLNGTMDTWELIYVRQQLPRKFNTTISEQ